MKHLLNNLTEEEKNSIRSQHTGGMNVVTENFSKLISTKSGDVKLFLKEDSNTINEGIVVNTNLSEFITEDPTRKGTYMIQNGKFYITDETGKPVRVILPK